MADLEKLRLFNTVGAVPPPPAAPMDAGVMPAALPAPAPDAKLKLFNSDLSSPERLQRSMRLGADISPEVAARVLDVEKKSGLPRKYVEENLDELERAVHQLVVEQPFLVHARAHRVARARADETGAPHGECVRGLEVLLTVAWKRAVEARAERSQMYSGA